MMNSPSSPCSKGTVVSESSTSIMAEREHENENRVLDDVVAEALDEDEDEEEEEDDQNIHATVCSTSSNPEQYRDFYLNSTTEIKLALKTPPPKRKGPRGGVASAFPVKLHEMLSRGGIEDTTHIVSWQVHGRAFTVHQPNIFVQELMPRYFKQSKMTSFQRQLNLYGFMRKTDGSDRGSYYHELFLRGRPDLAKIMVRTRVKGSGHEKRRILLEPDFYKMPYCPEDPAIVAQEQRLGKHHSSASGIRATVGGSSAPPMLASSSSSNDNFLLTPVPSGGGGAHRSSHHSSRHRNHAQDGHHYHYQRPLYSSSHYPAGGGDVHQSPVTHGPLGGSHPSSIYYANSRSFDTTLARASKDKGHEVKQPAEITPCPKSHRSSLAGYPNHGYPPPHSMPSSSFNVEEQHSSSYCDQHHQCHQHQPMMHAPEDSEWTPPPFPVFRASLQRRPKHKVIQPLYYSNMVSPNQADRSHHLFSHHQESSPSPSPPPPRRQYRAIYPPPQHQCPQASGDEYDRDHIYEHHQYQRREDYECQRFFYHRPSHHSRRLSPPRSRLEPSPGRSRNNYYHQHQHVARICSDARELRSWTMEYEDELISPPEASTRGDPDVISPPPPRRRHRERSFEGHHFQAVDDSSLEQFENAIQL